MTILPPIAVADDVARKYLSAAPVSRPKITRTIMLGILAVLGVFFVVLLLELKR